MKGLAFYSSVSIGRYVDADSMLHRLPPAVKYAWLTAVIITETMSSSLWVLSASALLSLLFIRLAKLRCAYIFRDFFNIMPFLAVAAFFQVLITWPGDTSFVIVSLWKFSLTARESLYIGLMVLRFAAIMAAVGVFTAVTSEGDSARGLEDLLSPLAKLGCNVRALALTVALAFRFIPIIAWELETIVKAQASRGADFGTGSKNPIRRIAAWFPLFVPVTIRALERAELLAEAMETRLYGSGPATRYTETPHTSCAAALIVAAFLYTLLCTTLPLWSAYMFNL